jgi:hypothetical protein
MKLLVNLAWWAFLFWAATQVISLLVGLVIMWHNRHEL